MEQKASVSATLSHKTDHCSFCWIARFDCSSSSYLDQEMLKRKTMALTLKFAVQEKCVDFRMPKFGVKI